MSDIRRDYDRSFSITKSTINNDNRKDKDDINGHYHQKRTSSTRSIDQSNSQRTSNIESKVYVGNVPTDSLTDNELLEYFTSYGKVSDIRVYKGYIFVQYDKIDDAKKLIKQGQTSLMLKGNKLDVLPAMEANSNNKDSTFKDHKRQSSRSSRRYSDQDRHSSNYEAPRKRFISKHQIDDQHRRRSNFDDGNVMEIDDNRRISRSSTNIINRSSNNHSSDSIIRHQQQHQSCYTVLIGSDDPRQIVDCQIILVNPRQRNYGEEISSRLRCHGLITSVVLLREDYTLVEAIENATQEQCLYGIIAMPMHEERRTASFHILYEQTEEHRNLTLDDGYHIILTNFSTYKERIRNEELNETSNETIIYPQSKEYNNNNNQDQSISLIGPTLTLGDKLPLSMLLCLLADGRQLTLDEIDRVLVYLLEKKAKMLTLPQGTLPPLPVQYATAKINHSTDQKSHSTTSDQTSSSDLSSTIAEQIRQIFSTNLVKSSSLNSSEEISSIQHLTPKNGFDSLTDRMKNDDTNNIQSKNSNLKNEKDYNNYQSQGTNHFQEQDKNQSSFSSFKSNSNSLPNVTPSFHYSSSSSSSSTIPTNTTSSQNSFVAPIFSSYDSRNQSLTSNSLLEQSTSLGTSNFGCQSSQYFYPPPLLPPLPSSLTSIQNQNQNQNQNHYPTLPNSSAADAAAAIFQAYSQFNARPSSAPSINNQQQQIRK
ncbi:unnamed protein product [Adineta steineri]|uniref:RRM domain-containing protein n=1 Tax=Adineta steineri TaxID=433720 RepID=A0A818VR80_9BILA|nr:unnamed protein product [Adineta steineri]CAF3714890.1 unnamed protein product [Adineta steineri]